LSDGIRYSVYPDHIINASILEENYVLPENVMLSVKRIIEFLHQIRSTEKDLVNSPLCLQLGELAVNIGTSFHALIIEV